MDSGKNKNIVHIISEIPIYVCAEIRYNVSVNI